MSRSRTYWAKMNMDEARESIEIMEDAEVGRWFRSWMVGAGGKEVSADRIAAWSLEQRAGYAAGVIAFADAQAFSQKQRERVASRYATEKLPEATTVPTAVPSGSQNATETLPTNNEQRTTNNEQASTEHRPKRDIPRKSAASIPTEDEWVAYCRTTWPNWYTSGESWAYYQSIGWRTKAGPIKDWRAAARTSFGNMKAWDKLGKPESEHDAMWRRINAERNRQE